MRYWEPVSGTDLGPVHEAACRIPDGLQLYLVLTYGILVTKRLDQHDHSR